MMQMRLELWEIFSALRSHIDAHSELQYFPAGNSALTWDSFVWAYSLVGSRSFKINVTATHGYSLLPRQQREEENNNRGGTPFGALQIMVPFADLFNHHNAFPALQYVRWFSDDFFVSITWVFGVRPLSVCLSLLASPFHSQVNSGVNFRFDVGAARLVVGKGTRTASTTRRKLSTSLQTSRILLESRSVRTAPCLAQSKRASATASDAGLGDGVCVGSYFRDNLVLLGGCSVF